MTYYKSGDTIETKNGLRGKILNLHWSNSTIIAVTVKSETESEQYYKNQPVYVLIANITKNEQGEN